MDISSRAYFGVESLVLLARCDEERPCTAQRLAVSINRSLSYTEALLADLREAGLVEARRGHHGGYYLIRRPERITVGEIFQAFDEPRTFEEISGIALTPQKLDELDGTQLLWGALKSYILLFLHGISLADIVPQGDGVWPTEPSGNASLLDAAPHLRH